MPKSAAEIIAQADKLADYFESDFEPAVSLEVAAVRAAAHRRAVAESETVEAVLKAAEAGASWRMIGEALGTSGEAARQRYSKLCKLHGGTKVKYTAAGRARVRKAAPAASEKVRAAGASEDKSKIQ